MAVSVQTLIDRSVRNMGEVHPVVKEKAIEIIKRAYDKGIFVQISSGYRGEDEQNALYAKGRTKPGDIVTNARYGYSYHNFGLAVDYFLVTPDGQQSLWEVNDDWLKVAQIGKSLGFEWGGDWQSFKDYPHLQLTDGLDLWELRAGKKPSLEPLSDSGGGASDMSEAMKQVPDWPEWKWKAVGERFLEAHKKGKLSSKKWSDKAYKQELTYDEVVFISSLI